MASNPSLTFRRASPETSHRSCYRTPRRTFVDVVLRLRDGIVLGQATQRLRECSGRLRGVTGGSAGAETLTHRNNYLSELEAVEAQLRNLFTDPAVWNRLHGTEYWAIRSAGLETPRPMRLINGEAEVQAQHIDKLVERLQHLQARLAAAPGQIAVLDTHVLLHFQPPQSIDWRVVLGKERVRLILPLRVVEELDMSKYREREDIADRARRMLSQLWTLLAPTAGGPVPLRDGVTIEVPVDDEPRERSRDADEAILGECALLRAVSAPVTLVTDDTGLSIRAVARGIDVVPMPEAYLRRKPKIDTDDGANVSDSRTD